MLNEALLDKGFPPVNREVIQDNFTRWGAKNEYWAVAIGDGYSFGNWKTGEVYYKFPSGELMPWDKEKRDRQIEAHKRRVERERVEKHANVADSVSDYLEGLSMGRNAYLDKKGVTGEFLIDGDKLVIPLNDVNGEVWTYQTIDSAGRKLLAKGGKKKGCYYDISEGKGRGTVYICEGFATAWSVNESLQEGYAVMAVDVYNMKAVASEFVAAGHDVIICADNDGGEDGGVGVKLGKELAECLGLQLLVPSEGDFNDVMQSGGDVAEELGVVTPEEYTEGGYPLLGYPKVHGLVGEITDLIMESAFMPQYPLALSAAITLVGLLKGHKVQTETGLRTNMMSVTIAPSGSGKDFPLKAMPELLHHFGLDNLAMGEASSGTSLANALDESGGKVLMCVDEIGRMLEVIGSKNAGGYLKEIVTGLMKLFSSANSLYFGKKFANQAGKQVAKIVVDQPCLCFYGATIPENFYGALTGAEVIDGFLNRILLFKSDVKRPAENPNPARGIRPTDSIMKQVEYIESWPKQAEPVEGAFNVDIDPKVVRMDCEASQLMKKYIAEFIEIEDALGEDKLSCLWARAPEHLKKISLITAGYDKIRGVDVEAGYRIVKKCVSVLVEEVRAHVASNDFERKKQLILRIIKQGGRKGVPLSKVANNSNMPSREYKEVLQTLLEANQIVEFDVEGKGRPQKRYKTF